MQYVCRNYLWYRCKRGQSSIRCSVECFISIVSDSWKVESENARLRHELLLVQATEQRSEVTSERCWLRPSVNIAAAVLDQRRHHGALREDLSTTSRRCLVAVLGQRRHYGAITDETPTTSCRCLVVVTTVDAPLLLATLRYWLHYHY